MSENEYREAIETMRRGCNCRLRKCESSRDYWKFAAITVLFIALFCVLYFGGCFPDSTESSEEKPIIGGKHPTVNPVVSVVCHSPYSGCHAKPHESK
jgi:hypothetical protein